MGLMFVKKWRWNSVFANILLAIIALVLFSVGIVAFFSYRRSSSMVTEEVQRNNMLTLEQAQQGIDHRINRLHSELMQAALDGNLNGALYITEQRSYDDYARIRATMDYLSAMLSSNELLYNVWMLSDSGDFVIGAGGKYNEALFFETVNRYEEKLPWDELSTRKGFAFAARTSISRGMVTTPVLLFTESVPFYSRYPKGMIAAEVRENVFAKELEGHPEDKVVLNFIIDDTGEILYSNEGDYVETDRNAFLKEVMLERLGELSGNRGILHLTAKGNIPVTVQYLRSESMPWRYISVIPTDYIYEGARNILHVTFATGVLSVILSTILAFWIIGRLFKPVRKILSFIELAGRENRFAPEQERGDNEFTLINRIIEYAYQKNRELERNYRESLPVLQAKYIDDLINHRAVQENRGQEEQLEIRFPHNNYQVIVYEIRGAYPDYGGRTAEKDRICEFQTLAEEILRDSCTIYFLQKERDIVSVLNAPDDFYELAALDEFLRRVCALLSEQERINYSIGVGGVTDRDHCYQSYIDALYAERYHVVKGWDRVIYIDEVKRGYEESIRYSIEQELQLITLVKAGDEERTDQFLEEIYRDNLRKRPVSPEAVEQLFNALVGTAVRVAFELAVDRKRLAEGNGDLYRGLSERSFLAEKEKYVKEIFRKLCEQILQNRNLEQEYLLKRICRYLDENYQKEVSLTLAAETVHLSPAYFSHVFKEVSGENFVDYVNKLRLGKAQELLRSSKLNIGEVAKQTGYMSTNSFAKIFKKYIGVSPGQYRKQCQ